MGKKWWLPGVPSVACPSLSHGPAVFRNRQHHHQQHRKTKIVSDKVSDAHLHFEVRKGFVGGTRSTETEDIRTSASCQDATAKAVAKYLAHRPLGSLLAVALDRALAANCGGTNAGKN